VAGKEKSVTANSGNVSRWQWVVNGIGNPGNPACCR
jgi:hypothetical protein